MTGGTVTVDGPTNGGNGALDYSRSILQQQLTTLMAAAQAPYISMVKH